MLSGLTARDAIAAREYPGSRMYIEEGARGVLLAALLFVFGAQI